MSGRNAAAGLLVLRLVVGWVFLWHGLGKLVGQPFPGFGLDGVSELISTLMPSLRGLPAEGLALGVALVETLGGLALLVGWQTAIFSSLLILDMLAQIAKVHFDFGVFPPGGWEPNLVMSAALMCLLLGGPGAASLDGRRQPPHPA
jgi:putative oxidoreductase